MIAMISRPFAVVAALGWAWSLLLSAASLAGQTIPAWLHGSLFFALFPIFLCTMVLLGAATKDKLSFAKNIFEVALKRGPAWARYLSAGTFVYALVVFFAFRPQSDAGDLAVVSALFTIPLYALAATSISLTCPRGHRVGPFEQHCRMCGAPIVDNWLA